MTLLTRQLFWTLYFLLMTQQFCFQVMTFVVKRTRLTKELPEISNWFRAINYLLMLERLII